MESQIRIHPDEVLENLKGQAGNKRSRENLEIVHGVCRRQKEGRSQDFSLPTIGRLSEAAGGPKYTTIRTKDVQAQRFQSLIAAWASHSGGFTKKAGQSKAELPVSLAQQLVRYKVDPVLISMVGKLEADYKKVYNSLNLAKNMGEIVIDRRKAASQALPAGQPEFLPDITLSAIEREALRASLSEEFLESEGWVVDTAGRIKNHKGRTIFKVGFVTGLKKILELKMQS